MPQGSGFHHRTNLFLFTFATKVPDYQFFTKEHFQFFHFFNKKLYFFEFFGRRQAFKIIFLEKINHDMSKIQNDIFKDADRERKMEEKNGEYGFMQSE